jgi:sugar transferase EpsL
LRSTSLDELPELYNVIKGEMSIVGPRPLLIEYLTRYSPRQLRRHEAPPGITGWAQIHGRNTLDWNQVFEHDLWYVENMSPLLDLKIVFQTALKVVKREGVTSTTSATREKFRGNK